MPANTGDNAIINLGIGVNGQQAKNDFDNVVTYIQGVIKQDFNIDIKANNIDELRKQINNLGGSLTIVRDESTGLATSIQTSFKTANGEAVKLKTAIEQINGTYDIAAGADVTTKITAGVSKLQKLEEQLAQAMETRTQAAKDFDAQGINFAESRIKIVQSQIAQEKALLEVLKDQSTTAENVLKKRKDTAYTGLTGQLGISTAQSKTAESQYAEFAKNISNAKAELKDFEKIQSQAFTATNMDKGSAAYKDIQTNVAAASKSVETYINLFNAAAKASDASITENVAVFKQLNNGSVQLTSNYQGNNKALKEMSDLINKVGKNLKTAFAQQSDKMTDTQKIQAAVKAYQQYRDAVLTVDKAKASGRTATQQETTAVNQAKVAYEQCEKAILSNGEAVQQNTTYNREKNQITRNSIQALKEYEAQLGSVNNSMAGSIAQMIQMKLSFEGLQEAIQKVYDTAKELNDSMTDIQLVTQQSDSDATDLMKSYAGLAQEMGTTTAAVAASADEWLRQGKTVEQTYDLVKASSSLAIIGQMDAADATTALTAAINGYAMSSDEAMGIVDKLTQLDLIFAAKILAG